MCEVNIIVLSSLSAWVITFKVLSAQPCKNVVCRRWALVVDWCGFFNGQGWSLENSEADCWFVRSICCCRFPLFASDKIEIINNKNKKQFNSYKLEIKILNLNEHWECLHYLKYFKILKSFWNIDDLHSVLSLNTSLVILLWRTVMLRGVFLCAAVLLMTTFI